MSYERTVGDRRTSSGRDRLSSEAVPGRRREMRPLGFALAISVLLLLSTRVHAQVDIQSWGRVRIDTRAQEDVFTEVSCATDFWVALRADGMLLHLGNDSERLSLIPSRPPGTQWAKVAAGGTYVAGLLSDGTIAQWGRPPCAVGTPPPPNFFAPPSGTLYTAVAGSRRYLLALRSDGMIDYVGQQCAPANPIPALLPGTQYLAPATADFTCGALRSDGQVVIWNTTNPTLTAIPPLPPGTNYTGLTLGLSHCAALRSDGQVVAWGAGFSGQLNVPPLPPGMTYVQVAAGANHCVALRSDGSVVTWGSSPGSPPATIPGAPFQRVAAGGAYSVALRSDGTLVAFGFDGSCQVNFSDQPDARRFAEAEVHPNGVIARTTDGRALSCGGAAQLPTPPSGVRYVDVGIGATFTIGVRSDGLAVGAGAALSPAQFPPPPPPGVAYVRAACGDEETTLLRSDGAILHLGSPGFGWQSIPNLPLGATCVDVEAGRWHTLMLLSDGTARACGLNPYGQAAIPALPLGRVVVGLAAGENHSLLLLDDGTLQAFGRNHQGQTSVPPLPPGITYVAVQAFDDHSLALRSDGSLVAFGDNTLGQCDGPGFRADQRIVDISAGGDVSMVLLAPRDPLILFPAEQDVVAGGALSLRLHGPAASTVAWLIDPSTAATPLGPNLILGVPFPPALILDGTGALGFLSATTTVVPIPFTIAPGGSLEFRVGPFPAAWAGLTLAVQALAVSNSFSGGFALSSHGITAPGTPAAVVRFR